MRVSNTAPYQSIKRRQCHGDYTQAAAAQLDTMVKVSWQASGASRLVQDSRWQGLSGSPFDTQSWPINEFRQPHEWTVMSQEYRYENPNWSIVPCSRIFMPSMDEF